MSEAAAAVSTNVKVMLWEGQTEQDRVTLNSTKIVADKTVSSESQLQMNAAIADWWHCSREARQLAGVDAATVSARRFYETVDV